MKLSDTERLHTIAKNLDYTLRTSGAKSIVVISDNEKEGKSTFLRECAPIICDLYKKKILIFDYQQERHDHLEKTLVPNASNSKSIRETNVINLDYLHSDDLFFLESLPQPKKMSGLNAYFNEISKSYDAVFINIKTMKRAEKTILPNIPIDGALIVRSRMTIGSHNKPLTSEIQNREIPVIGIVMNEGV
jgi:hypothetical protein